MTQYMDQHLPAMPVTCLKQASHYETVEDHLTDLANQTTAFSQKMRLHFLLGASAAEKYGKAMASESCEQSVGCVTC